MTNDRQTLADAVDALTRPRLIHTWQPAGVDRNGRPFPGGVHTEEHPSLIAMLETGTGTTRRGRSSGVRIPIDAEALEMWGQIRDWTRAWLRELGVTWRDDLETDLATWHTHHDAAVLAGRVPAELEAGMTRMVTGWVTRIERKYDPDEKREWTEACPATIQVLDEHGEWIHDVNEHGDHVGRLRRCGARRIVVDGEERFAIELNVSKLEATCARCHTTWAGERGLMELRFWTNAAALDRELDTAAAAAEQHEHEQHRELTATGSIGLP